MADAGAGGIQKCRSTQGVAAGVPPGGTGADVFSAVAAWSCCSRRRDAAHYIRQDA